jgi:hypothetical protein
MNRTAVIRAAIAVVLRLAGLIVAYLILRTIGLHSFTSIDNEGLNTLILLVGSIYAVILAFAIFVIWGQFTGVEDYVTRECSSLHELLRFSGYVGDDLARSIQRAVSDYAREVHRREWPALGGGRRWKQSEDLFTDLMKTASSGGIGTGPQAILIEITREAAERRAERVTKSLTRIPPTMFWFVNAIACTLLLLVFVYPFHHAATGAACLTLVALVLSLANLVMNDMDNPMEGAWNVSSKPFLELSA